jgi:hypothetical protein
MTVLYYRSGSSTKSEFSVPCDKIREFYDQRKIRGIDEVDRVVVNIWKYFKEGKTN